MKQTILTGAAAALSLALALTLSGAGAGSAQQPGLAAKVNGEGISIQLLQRTVDATTRMGYGNMTQPAAYKKVQRQVLDQLISQELLWQEARRTGFVAAPDEVDEVVAQLRARYDSETAYRLELEKNGFTVESHREDVKRQISVRRWAHETFVEEASVSNEEVHAFYVANEERFMRPEMVRARHVLIKLGPDADEAGEAAARQKIEEILGKAKQSADFATLAREFSEGPSASRGGDLGFFGPGQMVEPFETAAFALQPGEVSDVVRTKFGLHIIKLEERKAPGLVPEEQAAPQVRDHLAYGKLQDAVGARVETLKEQGQIEILIAQ